MNFINFCLNKYNNTSTQNNSCNNNNQNKNNLKKSSITINLRPDEDEDLEFNFTSICNNSNNNNGNNGDISDSLDYSCICNSGKKYELVCANCSQLICTSCSGKGSVHSNHKLLKLELNSIVFQNVLKLNQNLVLLENAKSNYCKVEKLIDENHISSTIKSNKYNNNNNNNKCNTNKINKKNSNHSKNSNKMNNSNSNNNNNNINQQLDQYLEFIDLAIKSVVVEEQTVSIKI